jgi:hypothetical protein
MPLSAAPRSLNHSTVAAFIDASACNNTDNTAARWMTPVVMYGQGQTSASPSHLLATSANMPAERTTISGTLTIKESPMGKGENKRKETKKKPAKTMAEKRAEKRGKGK